MVKYFTNIHLAMRVILSCEFWQICQKLDEMGMNIDYDKVVEYARLDSRLGDSHMSVPGFDGIPGARGHCVPGDTLVRTEGGGPLSIETLFNLYQSGNSINVVSCDSSFQELDSKKVIKAVKNRYSGDMLSISFGDSMLRCTPDHLVPVERNGEFLLLRAEEISQGDNLFVNIEG
jgi:hypothetical protein